MLSKNICKSNKKKCKTPISESAVEADQTKSNVSARSTTMEVGKEYVEVLKSSFKIQCYRNEHSKKNQLFIKKTETSMDKLFYEVIDSKNAKFDDAVVLAQAYLYMSHVRSDNVAVLYESEIHLTKCLELLNGEELNRKAILIVMNALNKLTRLTHVLKNNKRSRALLNYSLQLYIRYVKENEYLDPIHVPSVFGIEHCESKVSLVELYKDVAVLLSIIHNAKQDDHLNKIYLANAMESTKVMRMDVSDDFFKVIKSSSRLRDIHSLTECSDRKKKLIGVIEARMDKLFHDVICSTDTKFNDIVVLAQAYLYISVCNTKTQKEDLHNYEGRLMKCTELLKGKELDCKTILIAIRAFNELAYIKFKLEEPEKSESLLNNAIRLYEAYTKGADEYPDVIDIAVTLDIEYNENCKNLFEYSHEISLICLKILQNKRPLIYEDLWNDLSKWIHAVEETKSTKSVKFEIKKVRKELVEIFKSSVKMKDIDSALNKQNFRTTVGKMDKLFLCAINSKDINFNEIVILAYAYYYVSNIFMTKKKEDLYSRRRYMTKCMQLLDGKELDPKAILLSMAALEQLTNIWTKLGHTENSKLCLYKAIRLYTAYTKEIDFPYPVNAANVVYLEDDKNYKTTLDILYNNILNLFILNIKKVTNAADQRAMYNMVIRMHETLKEKFNTLELLRDSYYNVLITHTRALYKYFVLHKRFNEAKNYLAVASYILKKFHTERYTKVVQDRFPLRKEALHNTYRYNKVYLMRNFAEYGIVLLRISREKLLQIKQNANEEDDRLCEASSSRVDFPTTSKEQCTELLMSFTDVEKEIEQSTGIITDKYLLNYNDAKIIFVNVLKWLDEAKANCDLDKDANIREEIVIDTGYAYKYFAYYEQDEDKRIKLFKRCIEILENAIIYSANNVTPDIWLVLGLVYTAILEIKTNSLQITDNAKLSDGRSLDIDKLAKFSMQNLQLFVDSESNV